MKGIHVLNQKIIRLVNNFSNLTAVFGNYKIQYMLHKAQF